MSKKFDLTCKRWFTILSDQIFCWALGKEMTVRPHIQREGQNRVHMNMLLGSYWIYIWIYFSWVCFVKSGWFDLIFNCPRFFNLIPSYSPAFSPQLDKREYIDEKARHCPTTCLLKTKTKPCRESDAGANLFQAKTIKGVGNFPFCKQIPTKKGWRLSK